MMRSVLRGVVMVLLLLGLVVPLAAQSTSGSVQGTVKDAQGAAIPGVAVTAYSDALVARKMTAYTDQGGVYRFPSLPVGSYVIEAELAGFASVRQEDIRVSLGGALQLDITLPQAKVAEAITVSAEAPVVSVVSNTVSTNFDSQFMDKQPLPRNYYNIIKSAPGVNADLSSSGSAMLAYGSYSERQSAYTLDGVNVADAAAGQHWILPSIQWMQEIQVGGLGANAEYGGYTGGIINGVTKSGGNTFHGTAEYYYEPASWVSNNDPTAEMPQTKFSDAAISLGGKIVQDKLWYFLSAEYWHQVTTPVGAVDTSDRHIPRYLGKLTLQATPGNRLSFMGEYDAVTNDRRGISLYTLPEATSKQFGPGESFSLNWESLVNANNFFNFKFTGYDGRDDYLPYHGHNTPGRIDDSNTGIAWVNQDIQELNFRRIITADASWSLFADGLFGANDSHSFKFGATYETGASSDQWLRNGGFTYYDDSSLCDSEAAYFADPSCGPYYVERGWGEYDEHPKFSGLHLYAQDSLRLERLTLNVGLRYGSYKGGWQSGHGDSTVYDVSFVDPRIGFVWDVFGNARTAVKAHWGRYHEKAFTYLWDREASGSAVIPDQDCYWSDTTKGYTDCDPLATIRARMGKTSHPYVDETLLTFEQQLGQNTSIGVDFMDRRFRSFMAMINTNQDYELTTAHGNPYGGGDIPMYDLLSQQDWVLTNDNPGYRNYRSAVVRLEKRYSHGWQLRSSLVWSDLKGNISSDDGYAGEFSDINGLFNADGTMDDSFAKWEFKLNGAVDLPLNFQFSGQYTYLTGWYWTPYVRVRNLDYNAYTGRYMNLTPRGSQQLPNRSLIDLRLAWTAKLSRTLNLTASLECFNCQNKATVLNVGKRWGDYRLGSSNPWRPTSSFGVPTQIENPREIRAGIRFDF